MELSFHVFVSQLDAISMPGEDPFESMVEEPLKGSHEDPRSPDKPLWRVKRLRLGVPPEMIAGEEELVLI